MLVCRYMNELQRKDKKVVMSVKALKAIYHMASSSVGKLILGKQYLRGYAMEQQCGKAEAEGKELPYKRRKKLQRRIQRYLQLVESWNIEQDCKTIARFARENAMKRNLDHGNYRRFREKRLQTNEFSEHLRNLWKQDKKYCLEFKTEDNMHNSES